MNSAVRYGWTGVTSKLETSAIANTPAIKYMVELYRPLDGFTVPDGTDSINRSIVTVF